MVRGKKTTSDKLEAAAVVQLWYGADQPMLTLELDRWVNEFKKKYPQAPVTKLEYDKGGEAELAESLHQAAWGAGLFADRRLLVARGILKAEAKGMLAGEVKQLLENAPSGTVALLVEGDKITWSKPLAKQAKELAEQNKVVLREFSPLSILELERWVLARAKQDGGQLGQAVAKLLVAQVGGNVQALAQEVSKLTAYRGTNEVLASDIDRLVSRTIRDDVFAFLDAVGRRDLKLATQLLQDQFSLGTSPQSLVGLLAWHMRVLASVRDALDHTKGKPTARELATDLKLHPFVVTKALQQIPYFSAERVAALYGELSELDIKLKSTRVDAQVLFSVFLGRLAGLKPGANR